MGRAGLRLIEAAALLALGASLLPAARSCPYCKVAAANLAQDDAECSLDELKEPIKWAFTDGVDYATAYMHRGYLHQDSGLILQPYVTLACAWEPVHDLTITPYTTYWNSIDLDAPNPPARVATADLPCAILHHHNLGGTGSPFNTTSWANGSLVGTGSDWYQAELMFGAVVRWHDLWCDFKYTLYAYPSGFFFPIQELGGKLSYDVADCWRHPAADTQFFLRPYVGLYQETFNHYDDVGTYFEVGLEPSFRCEVWGQRVGITLPVVVGMSLDNYYVAADGSNEFLGYVSLGAVATMSLPLPSKFGNWYVTGSVTYYRLIAKSLQVIDGTSDEVVGKVGISFAF
jgi:hypothetical protein